MAVRNDFAAGEVLAAADLNDTFASKVDYALPVNAQTGTTYTFVAADAEKLTTASNGSAVTLTIPPQSSVAWSDNTILRVVNYGAGAVTVNGGSGVTVTNTATTIAQHGAAVAIRTGSDAWTLVPFGGGEPTTIERITGTGTTTVPSGFTLMDILLVGGGQAGTNAGRRGAGGQGGFVHQVSDVAVSGGLSISITIGGGGSPQGNDGTATTVTPSGGSTYTSASGTRVAQATAGIAPTGIFAGPIYAGGGGQGGMDSDGGSNNPGVGGGAGSYRYTSTGTNYAGSAGRANTGGGGGGGSFSAVGGYAGGSGVAVLAFHN